MSANKTIRWMHLVDLLPVEGCGWTTRAALDALKECEGCAHVDLRTVQRDLVELEASGLVLLTRGQNLDGQCTWLVDPFHGSLMAGRSRRMDLDTAVTLKLVMRHLQNLLPRAALRTLSRQEEQADRALRFAKANGRRSWADKVRIVEPGLSVSAPSLDAKVMDAVHAALASDRKLRATCRRTGQTESTRDYSVLALLSRASKYQLLVSREPHLDAFALSLDRILQAEVLDEPAQMPPGFDLDEVLARRELSFDGQAS